MRIWKIFLNKVWSFIADFSYALYPPGSLCLIADQTIYLFYLFYYLFLSKNVHSPNIPVCDLNSYQQGI